MGTSSIVDPVRRWAIFGARSINDLRSRSARATAKSSSILPPAYMMATTIPARFWPSTSAPDIETKATASTPIRPAAKSRIIDASSPATTAPVPTRPGPVCPIAPPEVPGDKSNKEAEESDQSERSAKQPFVENQHLRIIGLAIIRCTNKARTSTIAVAHHHRDARPNVDYGCGRGVAPTLGGSTG